jgi:Ni/Co efflux regulator RcnB
MQRSLKRLLCGTMIFALVVPATAIAQTQNQTRERPGRTRPAKKPQAQRPTRPERPARPTRPTRPSPTRPERPTRPETKPTRPVTKPARPTRPVTKPAPTRPVTKPVVRPTRPVHRPGYRPAHVRRIHVSVFRYPRGYHYRRYRTGLILPHIFLSNLYYYNNWYDLGFGPPPRGYVWVRYGPDLLLVNRRTGRIVDVIYGVFYW